MKAIVKATGEIVEVHTHDDADFQDRQGRFYWEHQLYFGSLDVYRGKTTLEITYRDSVAVDSTVVYKVK